MSLRIPFINFLPEVHQNQSSNIHVVCNALIQGTKAHQHNCNSKVKADGSIRLAGRTWPMHSTTDLLHCTNLVVSFSSAYGLPAEDNTTQTAQFDRSHSFYLRHSRGDYDVSRDDMCSGERGTLAVDDESRHPVMRPYKSTITATSYAGRI